MKYIDKIGMGRPIYSVLYIRHAMLQILIVLCMNITTHVYMYMYLQVVNAGTVHLQQSERVTVASIAHLEGSL